MKINLDKELVKEILIQELFYNKVPEYYYLKEAGYRIVQEISKDGGCTSCTERNVIDPTIMAFISHTVNMLLDCGPSALINFKNFVKDLKGIKEDFHVLVLYKENELSEIEELLI